MKSKAILYFPLCLLLGVFTWACQEQDDMQAGASDGQAIMSARKTAMEQRSVDDEQCFPAGTRYRIWAFNDNGYLFDGAPGGILTAETAGHYIEMSEEYTPKLRDKFTVYGFTDYLPRRDQAAYESQLVPVVPDDYNAPCYDIAFDNSLPKGYRDYFRGVLEYDRAVNGSSAVIPFKHILSRVRVQVFQQHDETNPDQGLYDLYVHKVELSNLQDRATYDVRTDKFTLPDGSQATARTLNEVADGQKILSADRLPCPLPRYSSCRQPIRSRTRAMHSGYCRWPSAEPMRHGFPTRGP